MESSSNSPLQLKTRLLRSPRPGPRPTHPGPGLIGKPQAQTATAAPHGAASQPWRALFGPTMAVANPARRRCTAPLSICPGPCCTPDTRPDRTAQATTAPPLAVSPAEARPTATAEIPPASTTPESPAALASAAIPPPPGRLRRPPRPQPRAPRPRQACQSPRLSVHRSTLT